MTKRHVSVEQLSGKTIDCHCHIGVSLKAYACQEYPYGQTVEGLYFRQKATGVDASIVFPASASLFFDASRFKRGEMRPSPSPLSPVPYGVENRMLMLEVFEYSPYPSQRYIPFVSMDPARMVKEQLNLLRELEREYPIYGIKMSPVECQSKVTSLLDAGKPLVEFVQERNLPILLHTTPDPSEDYSRADLAFEVIEANPAVRFCLAHCIGFHRDYLDRADAMHNVWVDTAALKIQVQCVVEGHRSVVAPEDRLVPADYTDHKRVMLALMERYPRMILWGTDSPWYSFISRRKQGEGSYAEFRLSGTYEEEVRALDALPQELRKLASNVNTLNFIFGHKPKGAADA